MDNDFICNSCGAHFDWPDQSGQNDVCPNCGSEDITSKEEREANEQAID